MTVSQLLIIWLIIIVSLFLERIILNKASDGWKIAWTLSVISIIGLIIVSFDSTLGDSEIVLVGTIFLLMFLYGATHYVINKLL